MNTQRVFRTFDDAFKYKEEHKLTDVIIVDKGITHYELVPKEEVFRMAEAGKPLRIKATEFTVKDSGERDQFTSGMVRDTESGKPRWDLVFDGPMLERYARHLTLGAVKYSARNWMKAEGAAELERFKASAARHFAQWMAGEMDEDHAAAVIFNLNGAEYVKMKLGVCDVTKPAEE